MPILISALVVALAVTVYIGGGPLSRSRTWSATVTPLASIIGSGFLVCGPVLAREFGGAAALAMALLLALSYAIGAVVRFNIRYAEGLLRDVEFHSMVAWSSRMAQAVLAAAYAISVAYYLKLLAEFCMHGMPLSASAHELASKLAVSAIIALFALVTIIGGGGRLERLAHATVSLKIGVIAGMLTALAGYWLFRWETPVVIPQARLSMASLPVLLGLLVTVQGFETSRFMGLTYTAAVRVSSMKYAQWLSSAIYMAFLLLLTPFLQSAGRSQGVAGILEVMALVAPFMGVLVLIGAASSQLSAAIADTIGAGGLASEASRGLLNAKTGLLAAAALATIVVWLTDPFQVIAVASRAFALFYALQCLVAFLVSLRSGAGGVKARVAFAVIGLVCLIVTVAAAPAE